MTEPDAKASLHEQFLRAIPLANEIDIQLVHAANGIAILSVPYDERLIGDPQSGVIHGGVVTSVLDTCGGAAVMALASRPLMTATLDLRIDYMRAATPGQTLYTRAECFRETQTIVFVRATAYHVAEGGDPAICAGPEDQAVATAVGAFIVDRKKAKTDDKRGAAKQPDGAVGSGS
ncbi:MAG: PaaI family thioesterase [Pseudomonadota bacterium]